MRLLTLQSDYDVAQAPPTRLAMGVLAELTSVIPHAIRPATVTGAIRTEVYDLSMIYGVSPGSAVAYCFSYCRTVGGADPLVCGRRPRRPAGVLPHADIVVPTAWHWVNRSEEHTSELQSLRHLVCRLLLE